MSRDHAYLQEVIIRRMESGFPELTAEVEAVLESNADGSFFVTTENNARISKFLAGVLSRAAARPDPRTESDSLKAIATTLACCRALLDQTFVDQLMTAVMTRFCAQLPVAKKHLESCEPAGRC